MNTEELIISVENALSEVGCVDITHHITGSESDEQTVTFRFNFSGEIGSINAPAPTPGWIASTIDLDATHETRSWKVVYTKLVPRKRN
jgi:hypothetical protein